MSRLIQTHVYCDTCKNEIEEEMVATYEITFQRKTYRVDLCPKCETAFVSGWKPQIVATPKAKKAPAKKAPARKEIRACDECERSFVNDHGLRVHKARSHKK